MKVASAWSVSLDTFIINENQGRNSSTGYDFIVGQFSAPAGQDWLFEIKVADSEIGKVHLSTTYGTFKSIQIKKPCHVRVFYGVNDWMVSITELVDTTMVVGTA